MPENQDTKPEEPKNPRVITDFATDFLDDQAVAIIVKQHLLPDDMENPVIFPPTYLRAKGKSQDDDKDDKSGKKESQKNQQTSVYNLDPLGDGKNVVEVDSPQSDGNRSEPLFKSDELKHLVPQVVIDVNGTPVNLLDAGHRAGDAVVRLSSLADKFHDAFTRAAIGDHSMLAILAPTSILYGAWDSRSTQMKLQRIMKASVRAENVYPLTKSATFIPAADYVKLGAVNEELDVGEGDSNPLSAEGMKHALASQTLGGVRLSDPKKLVRTIKINLAALRGIRAKVDVAVTKPGDTSTEEERTAYSQAVTAAEAQSKARTEALQRYILGLALVAATSDPDLNLREGCNLRIADDRLSLVKHRTDDEWIMVVREKAIKFTEEWGVKFFELMAGVSPDEILKLPEQDRPFAKKDIPDAIFEKGVAEDFLGLRDSKGNLSGAERDKARSYGAITKENMAKYWADRRKRDNSGDPTVKLRALIAKVQAISNGKRLNAAAEKLRNYIIENPADSDDLKGYYAKILEILDGADSPETKVEKLKGVLPPATAAEPPVANPPDATSTAEDSQ